MSPFSPLPIASPPPSSLLHSRTSPPLAALASSPLHTPHCRPFSPPRPATAEDNGISIACSSSSSSAPHCHPSSPSRLASPDVGITGLILTKLDGSARGRCVVSVVNELGMPVKFVGVREKVDDLHPFDYV